MLIALIIVGLTLVVFIAYVNSGPQLPAGTGAIIRDLVSGDVPELVKGETGLAPSGPIKIWYEMIHPVGNCKGTILLIMGHNSTALLWTAKFYEPLVEAGYRVIRYDNRDVGLSTWLKKGDPGFPYSLEDMAQDGVAVLDAAGIGKAHIIGASMGGMIAQRIAISHSERVLSLTSIMSSAYMLDPDLPPVPKWFMQNFVKLGLRYLIWNSESGNLKFFIGVLETLRGSGPYELDVRGAAEVMLYETRRRRGFNKKAIRQQAAAIATSGSRLDELGQITAPTLVIHGKSDPLVIFAHAEKYAPLIPHADTLFIEGLGHDLPELYLAQMHAAILKTLEQRTPASGKSDNDGGISGKVPSAV